MPKNDGTVPRLCSSLCLQSLFWAGWFALPLPSLLRWCCQWARLLTNWNPSWNEIPPLCGIIDPMTLLSTSVKASQATISEGFYILVIEYAIVFVSVLANYFFHYSGTYERQCVATDNKIEIYLFCTFNLKLQSSNKNFKIVSNTSGLPSPKTSCSHLPVLPLYFLIYAL